MSHLPADLPLLTDIVTPNGTVTDIPVLTERIAPPAPSVTPEPEEISNDTLHTLADTASEPGSAVAAEPEIAMPALPADTAIPPPSVPPVISDAEMQELVSHFESRLEAVFTQKLNRHFEHLHQQAVKLAISELKDELPGLLRNVLGK